MSARVPDVVWQSALALFALPFSEKQAPQRSPPKVMESMTIPWFVMICGVVALAYALYRAAWVRRQETGTERMKELSDSDRKSVV